MTLDFHRDGFPKMCTVLPDGASCGRVRVVHYTPTKEEAMFASLRAAFSSQRGRGSVRSGETITQVYSGNTLWMSDTRDERHDHWAARWNARGQVLIGGLGLGLLALACALKDEVERVVVVDINPDVINLITPHLKNTLEEQGIDPDTLEVIEADLFEWRPEKGTKFDTLWFDIWPTLCTDDLKEHARVNRIFSRYTAPGGWRKCWASDLLKKHRRQEKKMFWA